MTERAFSLLIAMTVAGYALASGIPPLIGLDERAASVPYRAFALAWTILVLALVARRRMHYRGAAWFPLLVFWTLYSLRIASDTVFAPIDLARPPSEIILWAYGTCLLPTLALFASPGERALRRGAQVTFVFCALATVGALYVNYRELSLGISSAYSTGRLATNTLNPVSLGHLGISLALLSVYFLPKQTWLVRIGLAGLASLGLFTAAVSGSRGPLLAFALSLLLWLIAWAKGQPLHKLTFGLTVTVATAWLLTFSAFAVEQAFGFRIFSRLQTIQNITGDESGRAHFELLVDASREFLAHPLVGSALHEVRTRDYPHNVLIESFMATGVVGGLAFSAFLIWGAVGAFRLLRDPAVAWLPLLFVQYLVSGLTAGALYYSASMWGLGAATIAVAASHRKLVALRDSAPVHGAMLSHRLPELGAN